MSARILSLAIFLIVFSFEPFILFSQDELGTPKLKNTKEYLAIGYYGAGDLSFIDGFINNGNVQYGYGGMLELAYNNSNRENLMIFSKQYYFSKNNLLKVETFEFSIGPRFEMDKNIFSELTIGGLLVKKNVRYFEYFFDEFNQYYREDADFGFAFCAALGKKIRLGNTTDFVTKVRLVSAYSFSKEFYLYLNAVLGVSFNTKKAPNEKPLKPTSLGVALIAGINRPDNTINPGSWAGSYGLEISYKTSPKVEIVLSGIYNSILRTRGYVSYRNDLTSVTAAGRFFLSRSRLIPFFEFGGGYYAYTNAYSQTGEYVNPTKEYAGFCTGTGLSVALSRALSVIAKLNYNFLFKEVPSTAPSYLALQGGVRFNL